MKHFIAVIVFTVTAGAIVHSQSLKISVTNPSSVARQSETVTLNLDGLFQTNPEFRGKNLSVFESSKKLVHQLIDENLDGIPDILIFQSSFKPNEKKSFALRVFPTSEINGGSVVDGIFTLPRQDFAWENDRIAFRVYGSPLAGDVNNGIDVWNKRVRYPIVEKWYAGEEKIPPISYHQDHGEGADYFSVGKSLGCGSAGILWKGIIVQSGLFSHYRIITNGPIRVSFELYYPKVKLDTFDCLEIKRITLDAGSNLNKIEEQFISNIPVNQFLITTGLVKRKNTTGTQHAKSEWMALWGPTTEDSAAGYLGTAVVTGGSHASVISEDSVHLISTSTVKKNAKFTYYAGAGWTLSNDFKSEKDWISYIEQYSELLKRPLIISLSK